MTTPRPLLRRSPAPKSAKGYLLLALAFATCPCHLPLLLAVLAGTGLAGVLSQHFWAVFVALSATFLVSPLLALRALGGGEERRT